jgi:hypothetical protein
MAPVSGLATSPRVVLVLNVLMLSVDAQDDQTLNSVY